MRDIAETVATRFGLDESEARHAIETVDETIGPGRTLADGRPGSAHPLSESRPPKRRG